MQNDNIPEEMGEVYERSNLSFETTYLRLSYAKNVATIKVPKELYDIHMQTVNVRSFRAYMSNTSMSTCMGFSKDDFHSISMWHLTCYLTSMSLLTECDARADFILKYQGRNGESSFPTDMDFIKKDQSNFMAFLSQRMSDLNRVIVQRSKNVFGSNSIKKLYRMAVDAKASLGDEYFRAMPDADLKKLGYHVLENVKAKPIIKKAGDDYRNYDIFEVEGVRYRKIFRTPEINVYLENIKDWQNLPFSNLVENQEESYSSNMINTRKDRLLSRYENSSPQRKKKMLERLRRFLSKKGLLAEMAITSSLLSKLAK